MSLDTLDINLKRDKKVTVTSDIEPIVNTVHETCHRVHEEVFRWNFHPTSGDWNLGAEILEIRLKTRAYYFYYASFREFFMICANNSTILYFYVELKILLNY